MICDRTFKELIDVAEAKVHGWQTKFIFRLFTCAWRTLNADNYVKANQCFKIIACDPLDDTVEQFASLAVGVADQLSKQDYS